MLYPPLEAIMLCEALCLLGREHPGVIQCSQRREQGARSQFIHAPAMN